MDRLYWVYTVVNYINTNSVTKVGVLLYKVWRFGEYKRKRKLQETHTVLVTFALYFAFCTDCFISTMFHLHFDSHADFQHAISLLEGADLDGISISQPLTLQVHTLGDLTSVLLRLLPQGLNIYIVCAWSPYYEAGAHLKVRALRRMIASWKSFLNSKFNPSFIILRVFWPFLFCCVKFTVALQWQYKQGKLPALT